MLRVEAGVMEDFSQFSYSTLSSKFSWYTYTTELVSFYTLSCPPLVDLLCCRSVPKSCPTLWDPMDLSTPGSSVLHYLPEFAQTYVHWVGDAIQPFHPLLPSSPLALNLSQHQGLFQGDFPPWWIPRQEIPSILNSCHIYTTSRMCPWEESSLFLWQQTGHADLVETFSSNFPWWATEAIIKEFPEAKWCSLSFTWSMKIASKVESTGRSKVLHANSNQCELKKKDFLFCVHNSLSQRDCMQWKVEGCNMFRCFLMCLT